MDSIQIDFCDGKIETIESVHNTHFRNKYLIVTTLESFKNDNNENIKFKTENVFNLSKIKKYTIKIIN
jgi:hypothetical protein